MMDAWLPEFMYHPGGRNLCIVRTPQIQEIIEEGIRRGTVFGESVSVSRVIESQIGVIRAKKVLQISTCRHGRTKSLLCERRSLRKRFTVGSSVGRPRLFELWLYRARRCMAGRSHKAWAEAHGDTRQFKHKMWLIALWTQFLQIGERVERRGYRWIAKLSTRLTQWKRK